MARNVHHLENVDAPLAADVRNPARNEWPANDAGSNRIRARPGRDQWILAISYPQNAKTTEIQFSGTRDEAITAVCRKIDGWLKKQGTTGARR
jgi:hypothetical protein